MQSQNFKLLFDRLMEREGGISNDPVDRGGLTKYGITKPFLAGYLGIAVSDVSDDQIINLSRMTAENAYWTVIWNREHLDLLPNDIAEFMFDWIVTSGPWCIKDLQDAVGAPADGVIGPFTSKKTIEWHWNTADYMDILKHIRFEHLISLCRLDKGQLKHLQGWYNRIHVRW